MSHHLTVDAGNSNLTLALYQNSILLGVERIPTRPFLAPEALAKPWLALLQKHRVEPRGVHLCVCSVVPDYNAALQETGELMGGESFHWVNVESPHGFNLQPPARDEIGADLIAGLVGARGKTAGALVVVDCGTATTLSLLSSNDEVVGVAILPGIKTQLESLILKAPHLADVLKVEAPPLPFGTDTVSAIQSGILYGHAGTVEGFVERYRMLEGFANAEVFGCGGLFATIAALCPSVRHAETLLVNDGCRVLSQRQLQEAF